MIALNYIVKRIFVLVSLITKRNVPREFQHHNRASHTLPSLPRDRQLVLLHQNPQDKNSASSFSASCLIFAPTQRSSSASSGPCRGMSSSITLRIRQATGFRSLAKVSQPSSVPQAGLNHRLQRDQPPAVSLPDVLPLPNLC